MEPLLLQIRMLLLLQHNKSEVIWEILQIKEFTRVRQDLLGIYIDRIDIYNLDY